MYSMKFLALAIAFLFALEFVSCDDDNVYFRVPSSAVSARRYIKIRFRWERPSGMYYDVAYMDEGAEMKMAMLKVVNDEAAYENEVNVLRRLAGVEGVAQLIDNWEDNEARFIVHGPSATIMT
ncbi:hypothetical protein Ddc_12025 [Ditylenchus destructor]|nr:hypothetical protein Ddc_12025 [Ditylenchus destructor]